MKKILLLSMTVLLMTASSYSQENPVRIGLKFGVPNLIGLNLEYVTPLLNGKLAPTLDFSTIKVNSDEVGISFSYVELGGNYYLGQESKGLYGHLSYGRIGFKGTYSDPILGEGEGKIGINLVNLKVGAKLGNSFYVRPEIGFATMVGDATVKVEYSDPNNNTTYIEEEEVPGYLSGGVVFSLGIGVAF